MNLMWRIGGTIGLLIVLAPASCVNSSSSMPAADDNEALIFSAATSTKDLMETLGREFSADYGTRVNVNAGPSNALATQVVAGAPADLFLSASRRWAEEVQKAGQATATVRLLTNQLVIVVPRDNPGQVQRPEDLLSPSVQFVALAGENVPAGIYADQALTKLGLFQQITEARKIVRGQDVRSALSFVERGEAEAGIVYSTDVHSASRLAIVYEFDASLHDEIVYVLVLLKHGSGRPAARELYQFLQSPKADDAYRRFGFTRMR
jgi:molybdate transport system substrate-binding protein